jgi:hypothetical protein
MPLVGGTNELINDIRESLLYKSNHPDCDTTTPMEWRLSLFTLSADGVLPHYCATVSAAG